MSEFHPKGSRVRVTFEGEVAYHDAASLGVVADGDRVTTAFVPQEMNHRNFRVEPVDAPPAQPQPVYDAWLTDRGLRLEALRLAHSMSDPRGSTAIITEAEAFLAFLTKGA